MTREASAELLWALDEDKMSVACIILDAIAASPIDCRSAKRSLRDLSRLILQVCTGGVNGVGRGHSNDEGVQSPTEPRVEKPSGHPQVCKPQDKHLQTLPTSCPTQLCQLAR